MKAFARVACAASAALLAACSGGDENPDALNAQEVDTNATAAGAVLPVGNAQAAAPAAEASPPSAEQQAAPRSQESEPPPPPRRTTPAQPAAPEPEPEPEPQPEPQPDPDPHAGHDMNSM